MREISPSEMYGVAKKFTLEMMELPIHTHLAIVEMVRVGIQHRNLGEQLEDRKKNEAIQARQPAMQERGLAVQGESDGAGDG